MRIPYRNALFICFDMFKATFLSLGFASASPGVRKEKQSEKIKQALAWKKKAF